MQVKLLRAIQEKVVRRVGGTKTIAVSARIVAATNRNLEEAIKDGSFRDDLYYRLNVISIRTPPLRDRVSDILLLMNFFLKKMNTKVRKTVKGFEPSVQKAFENYRWPGNVRELENVIERAVALESADLITLDALPKQIQDAAIDRSGPPGFGSMDTTRHEEFIKVPSPNFYSGPIDLEKILGDLERTYITAALKHSGGVKKKAAELLGVTFRSIRYRLEKLGIDD